ncbi:L-aspartate oxidase [Eubacterium oxidoreducens]|uniref:L-aspartate oxidase n=1 Tax=Eubacterium oxidoreducens TaxID=1732 RepID=A0A1G6AQL3_EUBOX|nr:L-aspartate oxidase [Eubacterium oxidoreducens]SDB10696.1 L-aspartate oxidase [Eubacterium oxidoreducens]
MKTDIVIVGSGCSGLYAALNLPKDKKITIITKADLTSNDSYLAQGGICMLRDEDDYESYFEDTMKAGHYENDRNSVKIMIQSSQDIISDLIHYGVDFHRDNQGNLTFTREGAHSNKRILFHEDITGKEITGKLLQRVKELDNVEIKEYCTMVDIISRGNRCYGVIVRESDGQVHEILANYTILACGGIGGLYRHSTNYRHLTGDALAIALKHGVELKNVDYVQIHPTTFYLEDSNERSFLISESVRGEGAILLNKDKKRFVNELLPRDVVTQAILQQMEKDHMPHVWLSMENIPVHELEEHFPNIVAYCREKGYNVPKEPIPVVPAQHYFMGGIKVDYYSKTTMDQLYAIGETACNGVHGKNRLASNSLLESLVFAKRSSQQIAEQFEQSKCLEHLGNDFDFSLYDDEKYLGEQYRKMIEQAMERSAS